jgi:hypothetical protein
MSKHQKQRLIRMKVLGVPLYKQCMENGKSITQDQIDQRVVTINAAFSETFLDNDIRELCQLVSIDDLKKNKKYFKDEFHQKVFDSRKYSNTIIDLKVYKKMLEQFMEIDEVEFSINLVSILEEIDGFLYKMNHLSDSDSYNQYDIYGKSYKELNEIEEKVKRVIEDYNNTDWFDKKVELYASKPNVLYTYVNTFEDLCKTNEAFLLGRMPRTFYYGSFFGSDSGVTHISAANTLSTLNGEYYIFTMDGQSNDCDSKEMTIDSDGLQQRSYLLGFMEEERLEKLLPHLLADDRIYTSVLHNDFIRYYDNFPKNDFILNVTREKPKGSEKINFFTNVERYNDKDISEFAMNRPSSDEKKLLRAFYNKVFFEIIIKKYCNDISADDVLLEHCKRIL